MEMEGKDYQYLCWLAGIKGISRKKKFALLRAAGEANLFAADPDRTGDDIGRAARILYTAPEQELRFFCGEADAEMPRGRNSLQVLLQERKQEPERIEEELKKAGVRFVAALEERFPQKLKEIPDPPFGIYYKGRMPEENEPAAAIIGARLASGYGREQARRFGRRIGARGIAVISGMARGIDGIAQKAALDAGGKSYAVLGCGVDICYPEENRELYEKLLQEGGVLSEYPPGTFPDARLFPPRNRIISGLSDLVLVIEARKKSGTLITVDMALEQGREVYALPGRVSDALSDGCNRLIRQGAGAATCPEDILEYFFGTGDADCRETGENANGKNDLSRGIEKKTDGKPEGSSEKSTEEDSEGSKGVKTEESPEGNKGVKTEESPEGSKGVKTEEISKGSKGVKTEESSEKNTAERNRENAEQRTEEWDSPEEERGCEEGAEEKPLTLEQRILRSLSREDEKHVERILEELQGDGQNPEEASDMPSLSRVLTCLVRLKIDGRVEETAAGYYRRCGW